jgi:hypothetical protein
MIFDDLPHFSLKLTLSTPMHWITTAATSAARQFPISGQEHRYALLLLTPHTATTPPT